MAGITISARLLAWTVTNSVDFTDSTGVEITVFGETITEAQWEQLKREIDELVARVKGHFERL